MASTREVFVATESYRLGLQRLSSGRVLLITGPPDSGKSCLAHALLQHFADRGYAPLIVKGYEEWRLHVGGGGKQVVLLDHVLGREELDKGCFHKWIESFQTLHAFACGEDSACLAIVTVNDHVLTEAGIRSGGEGELFHSVVDLSATQPFTEEEKTAMLQKHVKRKGRSVPQRDLDDILRKDTSGLFFPSLCKQYANALGNDANAANIFINEQISGRHGRRPKTTPLHAACYNGDLKGVSVFLEMGVNAELVDVDGNAPLHTASRMGHADIVEKLSTKSSSTVLNMKNSDGQTPLNLACECDKISVIRVLLQHGASLNKATNGKTPLHIACERGCLEIVKLSLEHGADVNHTDMFGQTPLHCVLEDRGKFQDPSLYKIVKILLQYNASVNVKDNFGTTPLDLVFTYSQNECIQKTILLHMAENDIRTNTGVTAIHMACTFCSEGVVCYLLHKFPSLGLDVRDNDGATPLLTAIRSKSPFRTNVVRYLLDSGADINAWDNRGLCPFEEYVKSDHEMIDLFVKHGADVHRRDGFGNTLLHQACRTEMNKRGLYVLIGYGVSIHTENHDGDTPLHIACATGNREAVRALLGLGSSTDAQNKAEKSPMDIAFENNHPGLLSLMMYSQMKGSGRSRSASESRNSGNVSDETGTDECVAAGNISLQSVACQLNLQRPQVKFSTVKDQISLCSRSVSTNKRAALPDRKEGHSFLTNPSASFETSTGSFYCANCEFGQKCRKRTGTFLVSSDHGQDDETRELEALACEDTSAIAISSAAISLILSGMDRQAHSDTEGSRFKSRLGQTRLHNACATCDLAAAETLLEEEEDVNVEDQNGRTPLHCASTHGHIIIVGLLLQNGSKVNVTDHHGQSPLHLACSSDHSSVAAMLLSHGADVNCVDGNGDTALHIAASRGHSCTVAVLVGHGAALCYGRDRNGNTALHLAAFYGHTEASLLLLHSGFRTMARNREGDTAMTLAASAHHAALVKILERHTCFASRMDRPSNSVYWRDFFLLPALVLVLTWICGTV